MDKIALVLLVYCCKITENQVENTFLADLFLRCRECYRRTKSVHLGAIIL